MRTTSAGVEPICRILGASASAYYERRSGHRSDRAISDERLLELIKTTHADNYSAYGYRRTWKALLRAGERVPRCQVQRPAGDLNSHPLEGFRLCRPTPRG